jgi:hypothetical protein
MECWLRSVHVRVVMSEFRISNSDSGDKVA